MIITCDDCGLSKGINLATAELHEKGMANSASIMTNFPATDHAFALLRRYSELEIGVHLNLSDGIPLTNPGPGSPLTGSDGQFHTRRIMFARSFLPDQEYLQLVEAELKAQIQYFYDTEAAPQHLTTHLHFHIVPALREIVLKLAREYQIPRVRTYSFGGSIAPNNTVLRRLFARAHQPYQEPFWVTDYLIGVKWWMHLNPGRLVSTLMYLKGQVEVIIHPGSPVDDTFPSGVIYPPLKRYEEQQFFESVFRLYSEAQAENEA